MAGNNHGTEKTRRTFLKEVAAYGGAIALTGYATNFVEPLAHAGQTTASSTMWTKQAGLELYSVRDLMLDPAGYESTLEKIAAMGFKEVEPADRTDSKGLGYDGLDPKSYRALLDKYGLTMPSTHTAAYDGPDLEKTLEGFQLMGIKYTEIVPAPVPRPPSAARGAAPAAGGRGRGPAPAPPPIMLDAVKRTADQVTAHAKIANKFGMKLFGRMDPQQFQEVADSPGQHWFEVMIANTDPSAFTMQLDTGWAAVLGFDTTEMFKKNPGRYELWHVKDAAGISHMTPQMTVAERRQAAEICPVGLGLIDFKTLFANAGLAGLKHYCFEQDNAAAWGDSLAAARVSYTNLVKILS
jgi:sugar phosphate isomerase/epimerase